MDEDRNIDSNFLAFLIKYCRCMCITFPTVCLIVFVGNWDRRWKCVLFVGDAFCGVWKYLFWAQLFSHMVQSQSTTKPFFVFAPFPMDQTQSDCRGRCIDALISHGSCLDKSSNQIAFFSIFSLYMAISTSKLHSYHHPLKKGIKDQHQSQPSQRLGKADLKRKKKS